jgi:transposase
MGENIRYVGLDVHQDTIAVAVADAEGAPRALGTIPHTPDAIARWVRKLGATRRLRACYEAGPCGDGVYRQLQDLDVACSVVAPTLVPVRPGDRVKTDRRDAETLARLLRSGELTAVWVPDAEHEALRDLVRAREAAREDLRRARHRLQKLLLRQGLRAPSGTKAWSTTYLRWVRGVTLPHPAQETVRLDYLSEVERVGERVDRFDAELAAIVPRLSPPVQALLRGLQVLRGVALVTALTVVAEVGPFLRVTSARQLMAHSGLVPREHASGGRVWRGGITKTGNAHLRRVLIEAAWHYRHAPSVGPALRQRQAGQSEALRALARKAPHRLHGRYRRLLGRGKSQAQTITALGRELLGFMWALAGEIERQPALRPAA